jgi:acid stress chaperone HdeB
VEKLRGITFFSPGKSAEFRTAGAAQNAGIAKMFKSLALATGLLFATTLSSQAEVIDLSTIKCSDVAKMSDKEGSYLMIWLHGYYGGKDGDTTLDTAAFEEAGKAIGDSCAENPELGLMTTIDKLLKDQ